MPDLDKFEKNLRDLRQAVAAARGGEFLPSRPAALGADALDSTASAFNVFSSLLASDGIRAALYAVLRRSDYRFISIFRFKDGKATSAVHVDREDLKVTQAAEVLDTATYCCYVRDGAGPFVTASTLVDPRTATHPAREAVQSYCGIPIVQADGTLIGTLCHYDLVPRNPEQLDLELLVQVSSAIARSGLVPPYPDLGTASK
jgi:GAF domain-containing protein